jgi:hypothetical protein
MAVIIVLCSNCRSTSVQRKRQHETPKMKLVGQCSSCSKCLRLWPGILTHWQSLGIAHCLSLWVRCQQHLRLRVQTGVR